MGPNESEIQVNLDSGVLTLTPRSFAFRTPETVTWQPVSAGTQVQGVALQVSDSNVLPRFRQVSANPTTGVLKAQVIAPAPNSQWNYLLLVDGAWFSAALDGSTQADRSMGEGSEEPPELVNESPDPGKEK